jgi:alkyl hydroperoxide reductase subunit AhpC
MVCTTELGTVANYYPEFQKKETHKLLPISGLDMKWIKDIEDPKRGFVIPYYS